MTEMNDLEKYHDHVLVERSANLEVTPESESRSTSNFIVGVLHRWYIVLLIFTVVCGAGIPAIWLLVEPSYAVTGAIRVAPILRNIITGETDVGEISNYQMFMQTQAKMIRSDPVLQRIADDLAEEKLSFFEGEPAGLVARLKRRLRQTTAKPSAVAKLKQALSSGVIRVAPDRRSYLMEISMKSTNPTEAKQIVDAFISAYMTVEVKKSAQERERDLQQLIDERKLRADRISDWNDKIRGLAQEYGTTDLIGRHDMRLRRVTTLLSELTNIEARRINLEAQIQFLEQTKDQAIAPEEMLRMRDEYVNSDPMVQDLTRNLVQLERDLIVAKQKLTPQNPVLIQQQEIFCAFQSRLEERREERARDLDDMVSQEINRVRSDKMLNVQTELEQSKVHEKHICEVLAKEDAQVIEIGRTQLDIQNWQFKRDLDQQVYDAICRRIQDLEMEARSPARVAVAYNADIAPFQDKRIKYTMALAFAAMACGMLLAFLRDKADLSLHTPDDVAKRIGIRTIGTTTSTHWVKSSLVPARRVGDYQTIRANLQLLNSSGMPKKLVVTSPAMREGKTTFAINLATSLAESGKRVLLIDGDLRKPDVALFLSLPNGSRGLQDVLFGRPFSQAVCTTDSSELDVLPADSRNSVDAYELIVSPLTAEHVNTISQDYDHVIIDTPPVLAFPDALLWAKIAGVAILTSFAGHTTSPDLRKAKERLTQINVTVLGTVLHNVRVDHSYYRYGYNHYTRRRRVGRNAKQLIPIPVKNRRWDGT